ncbi:MAG: ABC-F family ATP-binding cassette domain-containing protein [Alphaproteobacteria bacterium]|nr:elongation factor 3 [Hyphomonas sp.]MBR9806598.1 ABC-F family ATP-binding cassette domain-containing protein [Alphaproteobacteria bacterium]|tara:strand:+ start:3068 stop:4888 length:1821 start_codon:yes stop_codon:yes gene_type:complete
MAQPPLITLNDLRLSFGGQPLFTGVSFSLSKGERVALVGRNGAGKSTLMKIISENVEADSGEVWRQPGITYAIVAQEPDLSGFDTVLDYASDGLEADYMAEAELMEFGVEASADPSTLSGGQQRRAALAKAFAQDPDVLLLDEPTNHLDVPMIEALEARLKGFNGVVLLVSHDRRFLENVSTNTLWLRQGKVLKSPEGYVKFDEWAEQIEVEEERQMRRMTTQLKDEQHWLARGVTGRRKRNQGRLAKLKQMRVQHAEMRSALQDRKNTADLSVSTGDSMSKKVIEAKELSKTFDTPKGPLVIAKDLSLRILRGDRIGIIGPNGAGKTTLVRLLLGEIEPDSGSVRQSKTLQVTYQDQTRDTLNPTDTVWEALAPGGGDSIMVQGNQRHVAAYAKDFLFKPEQLRQPVGALSGGERNRLALAIGLAQSSNLLVMDEPTNDLDMQTLELLEDMLLNYDGTLILVSHDRAFLDSTVTSCLCPVGDGRWVVTAGGWSDAQDQLKHFRKDEATAQKAEKPKTDSAQRPKPKTKLSFKDEHRQKEINDLIPKLQAEIKTLEEKLGDPDFYSRDPDGFAKASARTGAAREELDRIEMEWLEIEEKREALAGG